MIEVKLLFQSLVPGNAEFHTFKLNIKQRVSGTVMRLCGYFMHIQYSVLSLNKGS